MSKSSSPTELIQRGRYGSAPLGKAIFVVLRVIDSLILQRALQVANPVPPFLARFGVSVPDEPGSNGALSISSHGLTTFQAILWGMAIVTTVKHVYTILVLTREYLFVVTALVVAISNFMINAMDILAFSLAGINPTWSPGIFYASTAVFIIGVLIETISETQRKIFKDQPQNAGKIYSGGLFQYARHINYCGYMLSRAAMATAGGGLILGALITSFFWYDFNSRCIPELDEYFTKKYGAQWQAMKRKVPSAFFPGIK